MTNSTQILKPLAALSSGGPGDPLGIRGSDDRSEATSICRFAILSIWRFDASHNVRKCPEWCCCCENPSVFCGVRTLTRASDVRLLLMWFIRCRPASAADLPPLPTYIRCRPTSAADPPPLPTCLRWRSSCCRCKYLVEAVEPARNTGHPDINTNISFCINTIGQRYLFIRFPGRSQRLAFRADLSGWRSGPISAAGVPDRSQRLAFRTYSKNISTVYSLQWFRIP